MEEEVEGGEEGWGEQKKGERGGERRLRRDWTDKQRPNYERAIHIKQKF